MNTRKKLRLTWDLSPQTSISVFDKRYMSKTYNIQARMLVYEPQTKKFSFLSHRLISLVKALYQNLLPECTKMCLFRCNLAKLSRGHAPGPPRMVVPSALPLKLICDVTRLWRNLAPPSEIFCVRHWIQRFELLYEKSGLHSEYFFCNYLCYCFVSDYYWIGLYLNSRKCHWFV